LPGAFCANSRGRVVVWLVALLALYCSSASATSPETGTSPRIIRVGAYENEPKIYADARGEVVGLFPEVLNHIARQEGWRIDYIFGTWNQCLERLDRNEIDMMVDVAYSDARAEKYLFSKETFLVNWATIYVGKGKGVDSLVDLTGKKVAVMKGSIHTDEEGGIRDLTKNFDIQCTFIEVETYREVFQLVAAGVVDAGVVNRIFGAPNAEEYDLRKTAIIFNPRSLRFAFPKKAPLSVGLQAGLDKNLRQLKQDPDSIYNRAITVYLSGLPREALFAAKDNPATPPAVYLTPSEREWIRNHPLIRLGVDPEFAPFEYFSTDGAYQGIASEYIDILNKRLGLHMEVVPNLTWQQAVEKARLREIDVLPCVGITEERLSDFRFSRPYIDFHRVIITRTSIPFLADLSDIEGMTVAVQQNSSHEGYLRENAALDLRLYPTLQDALLAVANGEVQAFVGNIASSTYWIRKLNLANLKIAAPVSQETQTLHFAVRDDWKELVGIINKGLMSLSQEEENEIRRKWVNIDYKPGISPGVVWRYILQITAVAIVILLVVLFWNIRLKQEMRKRIEIDQKLVEANKNLKKLDQLKSMFIASMSHELRTPLNSIIGFTGVILQGMTGPLNDKQKDHLTRVYNSAKHLLTLITDVIDISKIEAGRIDVYPQDVHLLEVVQEAVVNIEPQLKAKQLALTISVPEDLLMHTDRKRLLQCIINYLGNAVKFTETGSITLSARKVEGKVEKSVEILVTDTGIGISPLDQRRLFEAFERLDSHLRVKAGGTGLGLYLTRKLATEILGGEVVVSSRQGEGSTFGLILPQNVDSATRRQSVEGEV
jgi:signal transduction histidine kinase